MLQQNSSVTPEGLTVNWTHLLVGGAICYFWLFENLTFLLLLALVVVIHELGHLTMGLSFGCVIRELQVFFLCFLSYKPKRGAGRSWRGITWSLGTLPLGGFTLFLARPAGYPAVSRAASSSPFINDKPAWQRLLIAAGGVVFNFATFIVLFYVVPVLSGSVAEVLAELMSISLIFAFINILPVYPLDGGAIIFAAYEIVTGKQPSQRFVNVCGIIGTIFIILFFWVFPEWLYGVLDRVFGVFF